MVVPPFLIGVVGRIYTAIFSFRAGVMPPMPQRKAPLKIDLEMYKWRHLVAIKQN
jgi:hypothetical protein